VNLQIKDVDGGRMMLHVHRGKGARDRYAPLPKSTLRGLRAYWKTHRNPAWLFPFLGNARNQGPTATRPMNSRSLQDAPSPGGHRTRFQEARHDAHAAAFVRDASS
jgi:integrase